MTKETEKALKDLATEILLLETMCWVKCTVKANTSGPQANHTKVSGMKATKKDMASGRA